MAFGAVGHKNRIDGNLQVQLACPAAGAFAASDPVRIFPGHKPAGAHEIGVDIPAMPALAPNKRLLLSIQHSDDDDPSNFVKVPSLAWDFGVVGDPSYGSAAADTIYYPLPIDIKEYVRLVAFVQNDGGNNTAITLTMAILS